MIARPRMKMLAAGVGLALAQWGAGPALADSAVGVDMALGNALNPPGRSIVPRALADDGLDTVRRSPSGQLYGLPYEPAPASKTAGGWEYSGAVEAGVLTGEPGTRNAVFRKYKDLRPGAYLNYFDIDADKADSANYFSAFGGASGQSDQFYGVQMGRYNDWKLKLFYNETVHVFSTNWKALFDGQGTGDLTTGLASAVAVTTGNSSFTPAVACSVNAPCWSYGGKTYSGAQALASINGTTGTPNATSGTVAAVTGAAATGAVQSNMALAISNKLASLPESEISLIRKKAGARVDMDLNDNWKSYASYSLERRTGERPFAMNAGNMSTEIAEPIDYGSHEVLAGIQYADKLTQANLRASMSLFRNNISTLNVQYPFLMSSLPFGNIQTATFDLYPDNNAFNLKGEYARSLPDFYKGRFNAALSFGTNRQNDDLLAPISAAQNAQLAAAGVKTLGGSANPGYATGTTLVSNWNTTAALSQQSALQRIDTALLDLGLSVKPADALSMKGTLRYFDSANKGGYTAYNPLTGQFGRGIADGNGSVSDTVVGLQPGSLPGTAGSCYVLPGYAAVPGCTFGLAGAVANGANIPVYGQARSTQQTNYGFSGDYELSRTSNFNASLEREIFDRDYRERAKTWEDKFKLGYVNRGLSDATLRTSYETDRKRGGDYNYRTFADLGTGLPGLSPAEQIAAAQALALNPADPRYVGYANPPGANLFNRYSYYFRKYDQADRDQNILNLRLNYQAREDLDLGLTLQAKDVKYPDSLYGVDRDKQNSLSLELNYQPSSATMLYTFYSYQQGQKSMQLNSGAALATPVNTCTLANLASYGYSACSDNVAGLGGSRPLSDAWSMNTEDRNNVFGLGLQSTVGTMQFGVDYTYSNSSTAINYDYGSTAISGIAANQAAAALIAGSALPNMTFVQQTLNFNLLIPISKRLSVRLYDRFEVGQVKDWHYDNVITNAMAAYDSGTLLLDAGAQNYHANVIGFFIQYKL